MKDTDGDSIYLVPLRLFEEILKFIFSRHMPPSPKHVRKPLICAQKNLWNLIERSDT